MIFGSWSGKTGQLCAGCLLHLARRPAGGCTAGICEGLPRKARCMEFWMGAAQAREREVRMHSSTAYQGNTWKNHEKLGLV